MEGRLTLLGLCLLLLTFSVGAHDEVAPTAEPVQKASSMAKGVSSNEGPVPQVETVGCSACIHEDTQTMNHVLETKLREVQKASIDAMSAAARAQTALAESKSQSMFAHGSPGPISLLQAEAASTAKAELEPLLASIFLAASAYRIGRLGYGLFLKRQSVKSHLQSIRDFTPAVVQEIENDVIYIVSQLISTSFNIVNKDTRSVWDDSSESDEDIQRARTSLRRQRTEKFADFVNKMKSPDIGNPLHETKETFDLLNLPLTGARTLAVADRDVKMLLRMAVERLISNLERTDRFRMTMVLFASRCVSDATTRSILHDALDDAETWIPAAELLLSSTPICLLYEDFTECQVWQKRADDVMTSAIRAADITEEKLDDGLRKLEKDLDERLGGAATSVTSRVLRDRIVRQDDTVRDDDSVEVEHGVIARLRRVIRKMKAYMTKEKVEDALLTGEDQAVAITSEAADIAQLLGDATTGLTGLSIIDLGGQIVTQTTSIAAKLLHFDSEDTRTYVLRGTNVAGGMLNILGIVGGAVTGDPLSVVTNSMSFISKVMWQTNDLSWKMYFGPKFCTESSLLIRKRVPYSGTPFPADLIKEGQLDTRTKEERMLEARAILSGTSKSRGLRKASSMPLRPSESLSRMDSQEVLPSDAEILPLRAQRLVDHSPSEPSRDPRDN